MAQLSEAYTDPLPVPESLWAMLDAGARAHPTDPALTVAFQPVDHLSELKPQSVAESTKSSSLDCLHWTYSDIRHASLVVATGLQSLGVKRGSRIVSFLPNGVECVLLLWSSTALQLTWAPLEFRLLEAGREEQLREYLRRLDPDAVIVADENGAVTLDAALRDVGQTYVVKVSLERTGAKGWADFDSFASHNHDPGHLEAAAVQDPAIERNGERTSLVMFTSGTSTGKPKGCIKSARHMLAGTIGDIVAVTDNVASAILQTFHTGAMCQSFLHIYGAKGRHVIMPSIIPSPVTTLDAVEKFRADLMISIPVSIHSLSRELARRPRDLSSLKRVAIGGDMCTIEALEKFQECFPSAFVTTGHGMTEGISVIGWRDNEVPTPYPQYHGILTLGRVVNGSSLRICDENRRVLPRGQAGELHLGGPCVIHRYLEDAFPHSFYEDEKGEWMLTGDRALMDEEGRIFIIGRIKDIIKRVGQSLSPAVAESVLNRIDGVEVSNASSKR